MGEGKGTETVQRAPEGFQRTFSFFPLLMSRLEMHYENVLAGSPRISTRLTREEHEG